MTQNDSTSTMGSGPSVPSRLGPWATVTRAGVRTLSYYGAPAAHYHRTSRGDWRGVTRDGRLVYAATEGHLRQLLKEAHR